MTDDPDARLGELISDAAAGVEPDEGLTAIRSRTSTKEKTMSSSRTWLAAVAGAAVGTAAVITAVAVISHGNGDSSTPVAGSGDGTMHATSTPTPTESSQPSETATDDPTTAAPTGNPVEGAVPVYFAGDGPQGTVLYREFEPGIGADPVSQAASAAVAGQALDPDYRTLWPQGTQATASYNGDTITVDLTGSVHDRPSGMSQSDASLALQQVVYSVQGAAQSRAGVQFLIGGQHTDQVLGEPASEPITNAPLLKTLSLMSISEPAEGLPVSGSLSASGVANSFEATVAWEIRDSSGTTVLNGAGMADGWMGAKLFPWKLEPIDISGLAPGTYTFVASTDDPSGGAEGHGPAKDTRTFVVQ